MLLFFLFTGRQPILDMIFNANFFIGALVIMVGIFFLILPMRLLFMANKLVDHTTFMQRFAEDREQKNAKAHYFVFVGIMAIIVPALIQLIIWIFAGSS
ncbi:MAG: hypothetical protein FWG77_01875 [Treponema sp.]|nr:hypothetical protein [Treponema sp.]